MKKNTKFFVFSAVFAALIAVCTRFTSIPIPGSSGYVHVGDTFIFLAAATLPTPYAIAASAIGSSLADLMYGSAIYILPTFIIKALMALCFRKKSAKLLSLGTFFSAICAVFILVFGYYIADALIFMNAVSPLSSVLFNVGQGVFSLIFFIIISVSLDAVRAKERLGI